jgi:hypothetical protein
MQMRSMTASAAKKDKEALEQQMVPLQTERDALRALHCAVSVYVSSYCYISPHTASFYNMCVLILQTERVKRLHTPGIKVFPSSTWNKNQIGELTNRLDQAYTEEK